MGLTRAGLGALSRRVGQMLAVIGVVSVAQADDVGLAIPRVTAVQVALAEPLVRVRLSKRRVHAPHDQIVPLAALDVVRAVPMAAEVEAISGNRQMPQAAE